MKNIISEKKTIKDAVEILDENKSKVLIVVDKQNKLIGSITDGDIRRKILSSASLNINDSILEIVNHKSFFLKDGEFDKKNISNLVNKYKVIPVIDDSGKVVRLISDTFRYFKLGKIWSSDSIKPFVIAEIGNNHNGSFNEAIKLIDAAKESGADCAKFQMRTMTSLYSSDRKENDLGTEYTLDLLKKFQLKDEELFSCFDHCVNLGMMPLCTPWDSKSLKKLESYGMDAYKIASADFTNHTFLKEVASTGNAMIISTGMSTESEIIQTVDFLDSVSANYMLLHCNSTYPTPFKDVNLSYLNRLRDISKGPVGYSGHERDIFVPIAAVTIGAKVIEKHFTLDKNLEGNDHIVSLLPSEFERMVKGINQVSLSLGAKTERELTQGELINRENLAKSLIAKNRISKGEIITFNMVDVVSPGLGIQPNRINELVGSIAKHDFNKGDFFFESDLSKSNKKIIIPKFDRPYGVPVRYHDFEKLALMGNLNFVEFHMSYNDLKIDVNKIFKVKYKYGFSVHAPELFDEDHILDLTSNDPEYLKTSKKYLQRTINITRDIVKYFTMKNDPILIVNVGGWSKSGFLNENEKLEKYKLLKESLAEIDHNGVEIAIQTMPPFPWHFGGQSFHNLFVDPYEIAKFCEESGYKVCLDISHSMMSANFFKKDFETEFYDIIYPYVNYLHIVDAKGTDGEGIQIGKGDVNFEKINFRLNEDLPNIPFVPEVWQGHKDRGLGFWEALKFLKDTKLN